MPRKFPRPQSLYDFRMEGVSYELVDLAPGEKIERKALIAGYFYHVISGAVQLDTEKQRTLQATVRDTITVGGFLAHSVTNISANVTRLLVGAEPHEILSWMQPAPVSTIYYANSKHPMLQRLFLAMDLVIEEISNPQVPADQLTLERTAELIIFYFFRMANPVNGSLDPFPWSDARLMASISAMNENPARDWTVEALAEIANMSRSAFSERFTRLVGESPIRTLTAIRLKAAARRMLEGVPISEAASQLGYGSEEAFNRAFKRQFDITPGRWIRERT